MADVPHLTVVHAAAGCGKTTDLAQRYLAFLADGLEVQQIVAITFTRRAAAELHERVSLALRAALPGPAGEASRAGLGGSWALYRECAPADPARVSRALEQLPEAPIGTTDAFVQRLLTEFAVGARLPLANGDAVPLDVPIRPGGGGARALDQAARRLLDPPDGTIDPDVAALLDHLTLDEIRYALVRRSPLDGLVPAPATQVLRLLSTELARVLQRHDLRAMYSPDDPADAEVWSAALLARTNTAGRWAVPAVARWLAAGARVEAAPFELAGWLLGLRRKSRPEQDLRSDLEGTHRDFGMATLSLWSVVTALEYPYDEAGHVELADDIRERIHRLRGRAFAEGMRQAALAGDLGYDDLLEAAIDLCQVPPAALHDRFRALMVDEVQDANPAQLRFYRALAALPGRVPMSAYFVGDARQSIYLFRHAEPQGLRDLHKESQAAGHPQVDLTINHRSAPRLVMAHRDLFAALDLPMRKLAWNPLSSLDKLAWRDDNDVLALDPAHHAPSEPVWLVHAPGLDQRTIDRHALHAFLGRAQAAWSEPGHAADTAVVLASTWSQAGRACSLLRRWSGRDDIAWVDGATAWAASRVGADVLLLLRALHDASDDVAWLGVLKHPGVGLSDAALARIRAGKGLRMCGADGEVPAPDRCRRLGQVIDADALADPHAPTDQRAFARAMPPLRAARAQLGQRDPAEVVDRLATVLNWRGVLRAGPGGDDDVASLEVLLDWLRTLGQDGRSIESIIGLLREPEAEAPHVHLSRAGQHVLCTTIHQAKGLAWDHVCVLSPGGVPGFGSGMEPAWLDLAGQRVRLEGVRFDPYGGITPFLDPLGRLAKRLHAHRRAEESARMLYVAVTRARRSVTMGIPGKAPSKDTEIRDVTDVVRRAWLQDGLNAQGVARVDAAPLPQDGIHPTGWADVAEGPLDPWQIAVTAPSRDERAPSSLGAHIDGEDRDRLADGIVARIRLVNGLHLGGPRLDPPGTDPVTGRAVPGHPLEHLEPTDWGEIAHGWLATWAFTGTPDPSFVDAWLERDWGASDPEVRHWLLAMGDQLARVRGPLWEQVTAADARVHFELPMVGLGVQQNREVLLSGRTDLLVERPGKRLAVIDFKAGHRVPTGWHDLADAAGLRSYAPQLEGYAEAYRRMGFQVESVALWFARTGTSVIWAP